MMSRVRFFPASRTGRGFVLGLLCAFGILACDSLGLLQSVERSMLDAQFRARGEVYPSPDVVIVEANDATVARYPWPIPRHVYGQLIEHLTRAGAKTIAMDVLFPTPSSSLKDDAALIAATTRSHRVVQAISFTLDPTSPEATLGRPDSAHSIEKRFQVPNDDINCTETLHGNAAMPLLQRGAAGLGHVNAPPEKDGVLRRIPHLLRFRNGQQTVLYPSLALAATANYLDILPQEINAHEGLITLPSRQGERTIPLDSQGCTWVNWIGPPRSFTTHSLHDVLSGAVPDDQFKGKIVFVGITAAGALERQATPFSGAQAAVELQANAADDILMRRALQLAPGTVGLALLFLFPALIGLLTMRSNAKIGASAALGLSVLLWGVAFFCLTRLNLILPIVTPLAASLLAWGVCIAVRQWEDAGQLRQAEERYALAVRGANDGLWDWNLQSGKIYFSPRWKSMLGYNDEELTDSPGEWQNRVHPDDRERLQAQLDAHLKGDSDHFENQHRMQHRDGHWLWVSSRGLRVCDAHGKATRMAGSQSDISAQVEAHEQLERNAFYDDLTGLPNRALFMQLLSRALTHPRKRGDYRFAVLFLDLDRFKTVNDSLGHSRGDELLISVAKRIEGCLRPGDTAARLGGDEFTILLDDVENVGVATRIAERIQTELSQPFAIAGQEIFPTSSIGIALSSPNYRNGEDLLRDADTAMYRAKSLGRANHAVFDEAMHAHVLALLRLETDLRRAIERQNFLVYYQPIICLPTGQISGFEALVRWKDQQRGMVSPGEFIPLAEETGLIIPLDHFVLREACTQLRLWQTLFPHQELTVSVNLSSKQFAQPDLVGQIERTLEDTRLSPHSLKLEITEGVLMNNPDSAAVMLHQLRALGIRLSIDDFGTGYSSLSYLHRFPLDTLKVDQSFVRRLGPDGENIEIVHTIVNLARNLGMDVIAEGIETPEQAEQLRDILCEYGQGYHFSRPVSASDAEQLLARNPNGEAPILPIPKPDEESGSLNNQPLVNVA